MLYVQRNKLNRNRLKMTVTMIISMHVGLFMYGHSRYSFPFKRLVTCVCTLAHEWTPKACWVFQNKLFTYIGLLTSRSSVWKLLTCGYPPPPPHSSMPHICPLRFSNQHDPSVISCLIIFLQRMFFPRVCVEYQSMYVFLYMRAYNIQAYSTGGEKGGCVLQGDKGM